jgi:hypothetical protein
LSFLYPLFTKEKRPLPLRFLAWSQDLFFVCGSVASLSSWQSLLDAAAGTLIHLHQSVHLEAAPGHEHLPGGLII